MKYKNGITSRNLVVKTGADFFLPFAVIFGLYIILFGTVSPGGGFQGGVMVASAVLLLYLAYGYQTASKAISLNVLRVNESVGATCYVLLGFLGLVLGMRFCQNVIFKGEVGDHFHELVGRLQGPDRRRLPASSHAGPPGPRLR